MQTGRQYPLAVARMDVVGKKDAVRLVVADTLEDAMLPFIGRDETIEVGRPDDVLQPLVLLDGFAAIRAVVVGKSLEADVEAEFSLEGNIHAELDARPPVPLRDVGAHRLGWHELRVAPLDEEPLDGVGIVAAPELREVAQPYDIAASAAARAHHHVEVGVLGLNSIQHFVQSSHVIDVEVALILLEIG